MTRHLAALAAVLVAAAFAPAAFAKGPSAARIQGPGLDRAIVIAGFGEPGSGDGLGRLVEGTGFFPTVWPQAPSAALDRRPDGRLGPAYTVRYTMPGPEGTSTIVQTLYPYATPQPVAHVRAGQRFWRVQRTSGGWFPVGYDVVPALVRAGLPAEEPGRGTGWPAWSLAAIAAGGALALGLAVLGATRLRTARLRQPRPA